MTITTVQVLFTFFITLVVFSIYKFKKNLYIRPSGITLFFNFDV